MKIRFILSTTIATLLSSAASQAATITWDGASGSTWDTSATNWTGSTWTDGNDALFAGAGIGAITVSGTRTLTSLTTSANGYSLTGGQLNLGSATTTFSIGNDLSIASVVGGGGNALAKTGTGTLTFSGANIYTGATTVNNGRLVFQNANASTSYSVASGATLEFNTNSGTRDMPTATFSGSGTLVKSGTSQLQWGGGAGTFSLGAGSLIDIQGGTFIGSSSGNENWTNNLSSMNVAAGATYNGVEANSRIDALTGAGTFKNGYGGGGSATIGVAGGSGTFSGVLANSYSALILTKTGTGTQTFAGSNTYTGSTTVNAGRLVFQNYNASSSYSVASGAALEFNVAGGTLDLPTATFSGSGTLVKSGTGTLQWGGGAGTFSLGAGSLIDIQGGTLIGGASGNEVWTSNLASMNIASGATFNGVESLVRIDALTGSGILKGGYGGTEYITIGVAGGSGTFLGSVQNYATFGLVKTGAGTQILTGACTYTGTTTINGGVLQLGDGTSGHDGSLASPSLVNNASLVYNLYGSSTYSGAISGTGALNNIGSGSLTLSGSNAYTGATNLAAGVLVLGGSNALAGSGAIVFGGGILQFSSGNTADYSARIAGSTSPILINTNGQSVTFANPLDSSNTAGLRKISSGTLTLSASNSYTGLTWIFSGVLALGNSNALAGGGNIEFSAGSLQYSASNTVDYSGRITNSIGPIGIDTNGQSVTFASPLDSSNTAGLTKSGTGMLTLTASSGYSGVTTITAGTLQLGDGTAGHDGAIVAGGSIANSASLIYNLAGSPTYADVISGTGSLTKTGAGTLTLSGTSAYTGSTTVNGGRLVFQNWNGASSYGVAAGAALEFAVSGTTDLPTATFFGSGTLVKSGAGKLQWGGGAGTFSLGAGSLIDIQGGTFIGGSSGNENWTNNLASMNIASGATFNGVEALVRIDALTGSGILKGGYSGTECITIGVAGGSGTFLGSVQNYATFGLVKTGAGTQILGGANTYTGVTTISGGALQLGDGTSGHDGSLASQSIVDNANLIYNLAGTSTYNGAISGSGNVAKSGSGTLRLTNTNSYSGGTSVNGGVLQFGQPASLYNGNTANWNRGSIIVGSGATLAVNVGGANDFTADQANTLFTNLLAVFGNGMLAGSAFGLDTSNATGAVDYPYAIGDSMGTGGGAIGVTKLGTGTLVLSASNSYSGGTTVHGGTLAINATGALGAASGPVTVNAATLDLGATSQSVGVVTLAGGSINNGTLLGSSYAVQSGTVGAVLSGTAALTKTTAGTVTLAGANDYAGVTAVNAGILKAGAVNAFSANSAVTLANVSGATLDITGFDNAIGSLSGGGASGGWVRLGSATLTVGGDNSSTVFAGVIGGSGGGLVKSGSGTLTLTAGSTYTGATTVNSGRLAFQSTNASSAYSVASGATLEFNVANGATDLPTATFSGAGTLVKTGTGQLQWESGAATFSLGAGSLIDIQGGTFIGSGWSNENWTGNLSSMNVAAGATYNGMEADIRIDVLTGVGTFMNGWGGYGSATIGVAGGSGTFSGVVANSSSVLNLIKTGAGTQTLSGANTYTGTTTVNEGTLSFTGTSNINNVNISGGILDVPGMLYGNYTTSPTITVGAGGTLRVYGWSWGGATFGQLSSNASHVVLNGGTIENVTGASGNRGFSVGALGGTLMASSSNTWGLWISGIAAYDTVSNDSSLTLTGSGNGNIAMPIVGSGAVTKAGSGTWTISGSNSYSGTTTVNEGTLQIGDGTSGHDGTIANSPGIVTNATLNYNLYGSSSYGGAISGSGNVTKSGAGTLTLSGSNTYSGSTNINGGTLALGNSNALAGGGAIVFGGGALQFSADNTVDYSAQIVNSGSAVSIDTNGQSVTFANALASSNTGGLTKLGAGTLTLSAVNSYGGGTTVNGGTLKAGASGAFGTTFAVTLANVSGAMLDITGFDNAIGSLSGGGASGGNVTLGSATLTVGGDDTSTAYAGTIGGSGGAIIKSGSGTLTLTGANTYTGATTVNGGQLVFQNTNASGSYSIASGATVEINVAGGSRNMPTATFSGSGTLVKSGTGQLIWNQSAATFSLGAGSLIDIQGGTLVGSSYGNEDWTGNLSSMNIASGAIFSGVEAQVRIDALTGSGIYQGGGFGGTTTIGVAGSSGTFSGIVQNDSYGGTVNLTKTGAGTQIFTGANTFTGPTTINEGRLVFQNTNVSGSYSLASGATLEFNATSGTRDLPTATFSGSGTLVKTGVEILRWGSGAATFALGAGSLIDVQEGTFIGSANGNENWTSNLSSLNIAAGALFNTVEGSVRVDALSGAGTLAGGYDSTHGSIAIGVHGGSGSFSGTIADYWAPFKVTKSGAGTQILTGSNTYSGGTTIDGGILNVNSDAALGAVTGAVNIANGGALQTATTFDFNASRNVVVSSGTGIIDTQENNNTVAGSIGGPGVLAKEGTGKLILSGSVGLGGLNANGGIVELTQSGTIGALNIGAGGVVSLAAHVSDSYNVLDVSSLSISGVASVFDERNNAIGFDQASVEFTYLGNFNAVGGSPLETPAIAGVATSPEAVPEPCPLGLLVAGALGLLGRRTRKPSSR